MFDFDELEVAKPFRAAEDRDAEVIYSVRTVLDAPPTAVAEAVAAALLQGRPDRVDADAHSRLFVSPPAYAEEFIKEFGKPPRKAEFLPDEIGQIHSAAFSMGLRPLGPDESIEPVSSEEGSGFRISVRRLFLHQTPEILVAVKAFWAAMGEPTSRIVAEEVVQDETSEGTRQSPDGESASGPRFRRTFLVRVRAPLIRFVVSMARAVGWLPTEDGPPDAERDDDDLIVYRCSVQACGTNPPRTEVVQELLGGTLYDIRDGDYKQAAAMLGEQAPITMVEKEMKQLCYFLEEEVRAWAAARGFGLVEVWRGVRRDEVKKVLAVARFISTVYQCTPGEGAASAGEQAAGVRFNMLYAKKLAARFRRKRFDGVHGGAPGGDQLDGGQFTDGSVSIRGFALLLDRICRRAAPEADIMRRFVDLGAGRGNAVIAAHALFPFRACVGIEILGEHVAYSRKHADKYRDGEDFYMSINQTVDPEELFVEGDFLKGIDWSDASVVFCNAVTWPRHLIREIAYLALRLRPGAVFMLLGFGKFFPAEPEILNAFDFRSDVCLVSWVDEPQGVWIYQRR